MISQCPSCKKQIEVPAAAIGKKVRCSGCQAVFVVEASAAPPAPPPSKPAPPPPPPKKEPGPLDMLEEITEAPKPKKKNTAKKNTEPAPEPLDMLEEIAEAPAKGPKKKDAGKKKSAAPAEPASAVDDNPFSFEGPSPIAGADGAKAEPVPGLEFAPQANKIGAATRYRVRYAGGLLTTAAVFTLVLILGMIGWGGFVFYQTSFPAPLGGACCVSATLFVFVIVVVVGARSLGAMRSRGMGITAAVFSLLCALGGLAGVGMMIYEMIAHFERWHPFVVFACLVQIVICLWAGISGGLVALRADVGAAIEENRQATAKK